MWENLFEKLGWSKPSKKEGKTEKKDTGILGRTSRTEETTGRGAYGAASITKALKGADFPLTKRDIIDKYGNNDVEFHAGHVEKLRDVLEDIPDGTYDRTTDVEKALSGGYEEVSTEGTKTGSGVYGAVAITKALKGADFPLSKNDIIDKYGNKEVEYHIGHVEKLSDVLNDLPDETYNRTTDLERALHNKYKK